MRISDFLGYFYPDENEIICGRVFTPKGVDVYPLVANINFTRNELMKSEALQSELINWNKTHGIYFVVNAGGHRDMEISRINAVFCEIDDLPIQEQLDIYENCPVTPSLQVVTKKSVHAYWLLDDIVTPAEFMVLQKGLIKHFNSDEKVKNPSRVMRVPFFNHVSKPNGHYEYKKIIVHSAQGFRYNYSELFNEFPYVEPPKRTFKRIVAEPNKANDELVERIKSTPEYHTSREYGYTRGICHGGVRNNGVFIHLPSNAVKCFNGCTWREVCNAFGVEIK